MSDRPAAIVVGGGLVGLLTAAELVGAGWEVSVLDAGDFAQQASWAGGGILSPLAPWDEPPAVDQLARESAARTRHWVEDLAGGHGPDPEYWVCGMDIHTPPEAAMAWARRTDTPHAELPDRLRLTDIAQIRTPRYGKRILAWLRGQGVRLLARQAVTQVHAGASASPGVTANGHHRQADLLCLCAGAWTSRIPGVPLPRAAVQPVKGQMLLLRPGAARLERIVRDGEVYAIPRRDGRVLIGSTLEDAGFDNGVNASARSLLLDRAKRVLPGVSDRDVERQWAGLRPSAGGAPLIGLLAPGLAINTGHHRNGVTLAAGSAQRLVQRVMARDGHHGALDAFDPRFATDPRPLSAGRRASDRDGFLPVDHLLFTS